MKGEITVRLSAGFAWQIPFSRRELVAVLSAMRDACGLAGVPLDVTLADDALISQVNAEHLLCSGPTNILSFPPFAGFGPGLGTAPGKGMLLLSLDTLQREAMLYGQDVAEYAMRLLAHGMTHLTGLDHGTKMDALQDRAFEAGMREMHSFS